MDIELRHGFELIIEAENVKICEDIEERIYGKTEDGKLDFKNVKRDIKTEFLNKFVALLDDMIYYRQDEFDSSILIENLFEKLPQESCNKLLTKLNRDYKTEIE